MVDYVKIENAQSLVRDVKSHAVVNTDTKELKRILSIREAKEKEKEELQSLKNDVQELKQILLQLLQKSEK